MFESTSRPLHASSGIFSDPLEEFGQFSSAGRSKDDSGEVFVCFFFCLSFSKGVFILKCKLIIFHAVESTISSIDELENFAMGKASKSVDQQLKFPSGEKKPPKKVQTRQNREDAGTPWKNNLSSGDDLESFFSVGSRSSSAPKSRTTISVRK